jgi:antitoxin MazE
MCRVLSEAPPGSGEGEADQPAFAGVEMGDQAKADDGESEAQGRLLPNTVPTLFRRKSPRVVSIMVMDCSVVSGGSVQKGTLDGRGGGIYNVITEGEAAMKAKLIQIGNSRGVRLPKPLIKEAGLEDDVDISLRDGGIVIRSMGKARSGWKEAARKLHDRNGGVLVDRVAATRFDETEWNW